MDGTSAVDDILPVADITSVVGTTEKVLLELCKIDVVSIVNDTTGGVELIIMLVEELSAIDVISVEDTVGVA